MDATNKGRDMTHGRPGKLLLGFALPLMFGNICQQLYMVVDTAMWSPTPPRTSARPWS